MPLVDQARPDLCDYTVGFVKVVEMPKKQNEPVYDAVLAGSGVLVASNGTRAILTADHVLKNLPKTETVGLVLLSIFDTTHHRYLLDMQHVKQVTVCRGEDEASGPDLALLILPNTPLGALQTKKTFHNLDKRKARMVAEGSALAGPWAMCGLVGEMTQEITPLRGMEGAISFKGLCGPVVVNRHRHDSQFDYLPQ